MGRIAEILVAIRRILRIERLFHHPIVIATAFPEVHLDFVDCLQVFLRLADQGRVLPALHMGFQLKAVIVIQFPVGGTPVLAEIGIGQDKLLEIFPVIRLGEFVNRRHGFDTQQIEVPFNVLHQVHLFEPQTYRIHQEQSAKIIVSLLPGLFNVHPVTDESQDSLGLQHGKAVQIRFGTLTQIEQRIDIGGLIAVIFIAQRNRRRACRNKHEGRSELHITYDIMPRRIYDTRILDTRLVQGAVQFFYQDRGPDLGHAPADIAREVEDTILGPLGHFRRVLARRARLFRIGRGRFRRRRQQGR